MKAATIGVLATGGCVLLMAGTVRLLGVGAARVEERTVRMAGRKVTVWSSSGESMRPVVIFSHGFHGCSTQSRFLMEALADGGYLVVAPNHADANCNGGDASWKDRPESPFRDPGAWTDASFRDRADDVRNLVAAIRTDPRFRGRADLTRIALVGHSLGGYTVLGLAGGWPSWQTAGVKAVLALSPYDQPFIARGTLGSLDAPVMYQGGTLDLGITISVERDGYDESPPPKYFLKLDGAGHLAWTNVGRPAPRANIVAYSLAFLDYYVRGAPAAMALTHELPGVALYRYESELGSNGAGERGGR